LVIPSNPWSAGEKLHVSFYQNDTMLVDRYSLILGKREVEIPECSPGSLAIKEDEMKIHIGGSGFHLDVSKQTGLLENLMIDSDTILKSGPYLNLRVPGRPVQYSTIEMDDLATNWKCMAFSFEEDQGIAIIHTEGTYNELMAQFTIRIDEKGIIKVEYKASYEGRKTHIQEVGLKFLTGKSFIKMNWDSNPYFTSYPESHPGRAIAEVDLTAMPEMHYREEPGHNWEMDSRGFYYFGLEKELPFTNVVRSLKENIFTYGLSTASHSGLQVFSEGKQACRYDRIEDENTLIINDQWDYISLLWGNYMKRIPLKKEIAGQATLVLSN